MPAECEVPLRAQPCGVLAAGRCRRCERAVCADHRIAQGLCSVCYKASPELHCGYCQRPHFGTCFDCGRLVCPQHMVMESQPVPIGPGVDLYQPVSTGRCTPCRDAQEREKVNRRLALERAEQGLAPFPPLTHEDLGLRASDSLPTRAESRVRFDGVYERAVAGYPGSAHSHMIRFAADGRMFAGNYQNMEPEAVARDLVGQQPVMVDVSGGGVAVAWDQASGTATIEHRGWVDTRGNLILESYVEREGRRRRDAQLYRFIPIADLQQPGPDAGPPRPLSAKDQYKLNDLQNKVRSLSSERQRLEQMWKPAAAPVGTDSRSSARAREKGLRRIEALRQEEAGLVERMRRLQGR